jgi:hypothetical protein
MSYLSRYLQNISLLLTESEDKPRLCTLPIIIVPVIHAYMNIITVENYIYNNTISGTATEKGGNDHINTIRRRFFFTLTYPLPNRSHVMQ